jgi:hypothetical protein
MRLSTFNALPQERSTSKCDLPLVGSGGRRAVQNASVLQFQADSYTYNLRPEFPLSNKRRDLLESHSEDTGRYLLTLLCFEVTEIISARIKHTPS